MAVEEHNPSLQEVGHASWEALYGRLCRSVGVHVTACQACGLFP